MYYAGESYGMAHKKSIHGALRLYLDFINILALLQLTTHKKEERK
jgi:FtsH-binding integral membrane protein